MSTQQYVEPVSPWALSKTELDRLRGRVREVEEQVEGAGEWVERTRAEQELKSLQRELQSAEFEATLERKRQAQQRATTPPLVRSDCGNSFLAATNGEPQYMEPVAYWKREQRQRIAANSGPRWPETFSERTALIEAAAAELRRAGAV